MYGCSPARRLLWDYNIKYLVFREILTYRLQICLMEPINTGSRQQNHYFLFEFFRHNLTLLGYDYIMVMNE